MSACGSQSAEETSSDDDGGDCNAQIRIGDTTYRFHPEAVSTPREPLKSVGTADILGCDDEVVDSAVVVEMRGVPASVAVAVTEEWPGVYVAEGSEPSEWPEPLRK